MAGGRKANRSDVVELGSQVIGLVKYLSVVGLIAFICYLVRDVIIKITEKPPWLEFALAVIAIPSAILSYLKLKERNRAREIEARLAASRPPKALPEPENGEEVAP